MRWDEQRQRLYEDLVFFDGHLETCRGGSVGRSNRKKTCSSATLAAIKDFDMPYRVDVFWWIDILKYYELPNVGICRKVSKEVILQ